MTEYGSEWFYVWLAYGLTAVTFIVYYFRLRARRLAALRALTDHPAAGRPASELKP